MPGSFDIPKRPMMDHMEIIKPNEETIKTIRNLLGTEAGKEAMRMDNADGKIDGKISASVWNKYVNELFDTPEEAAKHQIQNEINIVDAMNSIATYKAKLKENGDKPAMGIDKQPKADATAEAKPDEEPQEPSEPEVRPDVTSQVEDDGKRHYYKKDPSLGEEGWTEISEEEYHNIRKDYAG